MVYVVMVKCESGKVHVSAVYRLKDRADREVKEIYEEDGTFAWVEESYLI